MAKNDFQYGGWNYVACGSGISSSVSRHLSTRNISSKSMHAFLSNLAHRQTYKQTDKRARACGRKHNRPTSSFVGGNTAGHTVKHLQLQKSALGIRLTEICIRKIDIPD